MLPMLETALNNSLVDMTKELDLMTGYFKMINVLARHK